MELLRRKTIFFLNPSEFLFGIPITKDRLTREKQTSLLKCASTYTGVTLVMSNSNFELNKQQAS